MKSKHEAFQEFSVRKASGQYAPFDEAKLRHSMHRSGADDQTINLVLQEIRDRIYENMPTKALYKMAYKALKRHNQSVAARYSLKQAMLQLGPSGFPFERFFAEILKSQGFSTETGVIYPGKCITHEVDVVAENDTDLVFVECKYHPVAGSMSDVKIPLYIHSRFRDLEAGMHLQRTLNGRNLHCRIATNTRFSDDAMTYGRCAGLDLIAWDYPMGKGLRELIDETGLHPVTCVGSLTLKEKTALLGKNIVLCRHLAENPKILDKIGVSAGRQKTILNEAEGICRLEIIKSK
jgi:hypothetical protein